MITHEKVTGYVGEFIAICICLILLSLVFGNVSPEPGAHGNGKKNSDQDEKDTWFSGTEESGQVEGELPEYDTEMNEIELKFENLRTRLMTILMIIEKLHDDVKNKELAGTDLEPFWNEYQRGMKELEELRGFIGNNQFNDIEIMIEELETALIEMDEEMIMSEEALVDARVEWIQLSDEVDEMNKELKKVEKQMDSKEEKIDKILRKIDDRRGRGKSTKLLEIMLEATQKELKGLVEDSAELENEIAVLELEILDVEELITGLQAQIQSLKNDIKMGLEDLDFLQQEKKESKREGRNEEKVIEKLLKTIKSKLKKLGNEMEKLRKKRGGNGEDSPEAMIEVEMVSLELKKVEPILTINVIATDLTDNVNELVHAESSLFTYSLDGKIYYISGFSRIGDDAVMMEGVEHNPSTTHYRVTMMNWYGNFDSDGTYLKHTIDSSDQLSIHGKIQAENVKITYKNEWSPSKDSFFDVFVEIDLPGCAGPADSFFDVFTEFRLHGDTGNSGSVFQTESFFDVFVEITIEDLKDPSFDMKIIIDLEEDHKDEVFECPECGAELSEGDSACPYCGEEIVEGNKQLELPLYIESFFDIFVEVDLPDKYFPPDSFFDIANSITIGYEKGKLKFDTNTRTKSNCDVDSFFDIFIEVDLPQYDYPPDSFFDVFCMIDYNYKSNSVSTGPISPPPEDLIEIQGFMKGGPLGAIMGGISGHQTSRGTGENIDSFFDVVSQFEFKILKKEIECHICGELLGPDDVECPECGEEVPSEVYHIASFFDVFAEVDYQPESFFDIFCEGSLTFNGRGIDLNGDTFFDVFVEVDIDTLFPSGPAKGVGIESFFDTTYHVGNGISHVDSFFDVFVDVDGPILDTSVESSVTMYFGADRTISAASYDFSSDVGSRMGVEPSPFMIESFFDVFVEIDLPELDTLGESSFKMHYRADRTISAASYDFSSDLRSVMGVEPSPFIVESFFDVFVEVDLPASDFPAESFFDVFVEIDLPRSDFSADSFFDVFVEIDLPGIDIAPESFFDVFFDITVTDVDRKSDGGTFETEIVSMSLSGRFQAEIVSMRLIGPRSTNADSFFDVFVDLKFSGSDSQPESFFDVSVGVKGVSQCCIMAVRVANPEGESFFDVFIDIDLPGLDLSGESFFDVFVDVDLSGLSGDSFFDVDVKVKFPTVDFPAESFFDVFVEIDLPSIGGKDESDYDVSLDITDTKDGSHISEFVIITWKTTPGNNGESFFDIFIEINLP